MTDTQTQYRHIFQDDDGVPLISGTRTKVIEIILEKLAYGWSPEEIHFQHPELTLGQIYSALAYYADHQQELDTDIEKRKQDMDRMRSNVPVPTFVKRLQPKK